MWLAQDLDGSIYIYESKPNIHATAAEWKLEKITGELEVDTVTNDNWKQSLVNLDTDDFNITGGILTNIDIHRDIKIASENGIVQVLSNNEWADTCDPTWDAHLEYRIKPAAIKYRRYLMYTSSEVNVISFSENAVSNAESIPAFGGWVDKEWQETS